MPKPFSIKRVLQIIEDDTDLVVLDAEINDLVAQDYDVANVFSGVVNSEEPYIIQIFTMQYIGDKMQVGFDLDIDPSTMSTSFADITEELTNEDEKV